jgi:hypothetical protein
MRTSRMNPAAFVVKVELWRSVRMNPMRPAVASFFGVGLPDHG